MFNNKRIAKLEDAVLILAGQLDASNKLREELCKRVYILEKQEETPQFGGQFTNRAARAAVRLLMDRLRVALKPIDPWKLDVTLEELPDDQP